MSTAARATTCSSSTRPTRSSPTRTSTRSCSSRTLKRNISVFNVAMNSPPVLGPCPAINSPGINALNGWILLRVGDNITFGASLAGRCHRRRPHPQNTKVFAGKWIDIYGDSDSFTFPSQGDAELRQRHALPRHDHAGNADDGCRDEINPGRDCNVTRIFGNTDTDTINFDQTFLGGRTHVYGSNAMTCTAHSVAGCTLPIPTTGGPMTAPAGDSEDFVFVNQLQTMAVGAGPHADARPPGRHRHVRRQHDGQPGVPRRRPDQRRDLPQLRHQRARHGRTRPRLRRPDRQRRRQHDVQRLRPGRSERQHAVPTDDIFLLRRSNYIGSYPAASPSQANEIADDPAFVALLHGNFGTVTPVAATSNISIDICFAARNAAARSGRRSRPPARCSPPPTASSSGGGSTSATPAVRERRRLGRRLHDPERRRRLQEHHARPSGFRRASR